MRSSARLGFPLLIGTALAASPDPSLWTSVKLGNQTFINKGLVGFGYVPASARDSYGETLGGLGSAIALERGSFKAGPNGTFTGRLIAQPDRGYNVFVTYILLTDIFELLKLITEGTIDWQARQHSFDFVLSPYYSKSNLAFDAAAKTFTLQYKSTLLYSRAGAATSGLDATSSIASSNAYPMLPAPPGASPKLTLDTEGLVLNADGSFWASDEYGPYVYRFAANGTLLEAIQPPTAALPTIGGKLNFTSAVSPEFGRDANQGSDPHLLLKELFQSLNPSFAPAVLVSGFNRLEGLTVSSDGRTLYGLLQSATIQDGGGDKTTNRYTRLFAWDVSTPGTSKLTGEWIVPLPQSSKGKSYAQSEIHYLSSTQFLVLSRDGHGHGDDDNEAKSDYKQADLFDISKATDIHGTKFDSTTAAAPKGKLDGSITPATYVPFVNYLNKTQLARFGLHNDEPTDRTLIDAKWESLALTPVLDSTLPDDYFLITMADNDFITLNGTSLGKPYSAAYGQDVDSQVLVWQVTLPSVARGSVAASLGI
ncbi:hypothetical protein FRC07_002327 [Ceratobasidium sp. 392]|nr:hypothetical protein FRC07_002327 [Ceratobasidium sp. 392]